MNDTRKPRAVSGEIVTGEGSLEDVDSRTWRPTPDIVDAEYEIVDRRVAAGDTRTQAPAGKAAPVEGLDMLRPRAGVMKSRRGEPGGLLFWATSIVLVVTAFWISGGHALLDGTSLFSRQAQAPAVRVASVQSRIEKQGGRSLLFVDGEAVNDDEVVRIVPTLSINVLDNEGHTTHYLLGTNDSQLEPGKHFTFSSRLIAPNAGVKSVSVTFKEQGD